MNITHIKTLESLLNHWKYLYAKHICEEKEGRETIEALQAAIKAMQPEPFINKPCVSEQACHEDKMKVLGKIRERIELEKLGYPPSADYYKAIMKVLQIIDRYTKDGD